MMETPIITYVLSGMENIFIINLEHININQVISPCLMLGPNQVIDKIKESLLN